MISGSVALLWLLMGGPATPTMNLAPMDGARTDLVTYAAPTRFASATLLYDGQTNSATIVNQDNVEIKVIPAEHEDLRTTRKFALECVLPHAYRIKTIDSRADSRYHLIPIGVLEYK